MSRFQDCLQPQGPRAVLLSVKPRFAEQILSGHKTVEFRRSWAAEPVGLVLVYSSSPTQRIVGVVEVESIVHASPARLWTRCKPRGPGLERKELLEYFTGKDLGYGILLGAVVKPVKAFPPETFFKDFRAPQSFRYLTTAELKRVGKKFGMEELKR